MLWNIKFFREGTLFPTLPRGAPLIQRIQLAAKARARTDYLTYSLAEVDPDILVVLETRSTAGVLGSLAKGTGIDASMWLLSMLRGLKPDWYLIPPLRLNTRDNLGQQPYTEACSVFYRNDVVNFIGPYVWPAAGPNDAPDKVPVPDLPGVAAASYPDPYDDMLPDGTFYAGQYRFPVAPGSPNEVLFTGEENRRPFLCRFLDNDDRLIDLFSFHAPPRRNQDAASSRLMDWVNLNSVPVADVAIVAADFNVNQLGGVLEQDFYTQIRSRFAFDINFRRDRMNVQTMYRSVNTATVDDPLGYRYLQQQAIDNIFTHYDDRNATATNPTILDLVAGVTPNAISTVDIGTAMATRLNDFQTYMNPNQRFRMTENFGKIGDPGGVSDHLALMIDI